MSANHFDQTALAVSKAVTITGGTTAVIGGLTLYELGVWVGIIWRDPRVHQRPVLELA